MHLKLRHYPYRFGLRVLRMLPELIMDGCREFPPPPPDFDPLECYMEQDFSDEWKDAGTIETLEYIANNKHLVIPKEWQSHLLPSCFTFIYNTKKEDLLGDQ